MDTSRLASSRQKSCRQCAISKLKCDRQRPLCARCAERHLDCFYFENLPPNTRLQLLHSANGPSRGYGHSIDDESDGRDGPSKKQDIESQRPFPTPVYDPRLFQDTNITAHDIKGKTTLQAAETSIINFSALDLVCTIDADEIRTRWMSAYAPDPNQVVKTMPDNTAFFLRQILKSYMNVVVHGLIPEFVHPAQLQSGMSVTPLLACLDVIRKGDRHSPEGETAFRETMKTKMVSMYDNRSEMDGMTSLAAFQAYLISCMAWFFWLRQGTWDFLCEAMINLQEIACVACQHGLVCASEQQACMPRWEEWIVAEAKRRTLYTMYMFDNLLSSQDNLPTYVGTELRGLPAPAGKSLWRAVTRLDWMTAYGAEVARNNQPLRIDELWPESPDACQTTIATRRRRVDQWLEQVDEYGTMLYAVTTSSHNPDKRG